MKNKQFPITLKENEKEIIEKAAIKERRSMANFLVNAALEKINLEEQQTKE